MVPPDEMLIARWVARTDIEGEVFFEYIHQNAERISEPEMKVKKVVVQLSPEEVIRFIRILTDEDRDEALTFLKEVMKPRVDNATREH